MLVIPRLHEFAPSLCSLLICPLFASLEEKVISHGKEARLLGLETHWW